MSSAREDYAEQAIAQGSQSFAAAARLFDPRLRRDVMALYAWCRHCDDVVDGQVLGHGVVADTRTPAERLAELRARTAAMLAGATITHPAWTGLPDVLARNAIPPQLLFDHLDGFAHDVEGQRYQTLDDLLLYCYGVAGVVGLMMAYIMGARASATLDRACDLGLAFQLTNIARDVGEDFAVGRLYLPFDWLAEAGVPKQEVGDARSAPAVAGVAARLVAAAEPYYQSAAIGLADLPWRAAWAVGAARLIYRQIGRKVVAAGPQALKQRMRTGTGEKLLFLAGGLGTAALSRARGKPARDPNLWSRSRLA